jgi:hypothetical protein
MKIAMCGILSAPSRADVLVISLDLIVRIQILQIIRLRVTKSSRGIHKSVFCARADMRAFGNIDRSVVAVFVLVTLPVVRLKLSNR